MALINCPECGKQVSDRAISCPDCGCPINAAPVPAAEPVQQNNLENLEKLLVLAQRARENSDAKNAKRYYEQILTIDPSHWEAVFYSVYFEAAECKLMNISSAANSVANCIHGVFVSIKETLDESEYDDALDTIIYSATSLAVLFTNAAINHYNEFSTTNNANSECLSRVRAASNIYAEIENSYKAVFPEKTQRLLTFQKIYKIFLDGHPRWTPYEEKKRLIKEISVTEPSYGRRIELTSEIESLNIRINGIVTNKNEAKGGGVGWFFIICSFIMVFLGFGLMSLDGSVWPFFVAIVEFIIGTLLKKKPSKSLIEENIKKKEELTAQRDALQNELDSLD